MAYSLILTKQAAKDLKNLDHQTAKRIVRKLLWFEKQRDPVSFAKALMDSESGDVRFRIGDYRAVAVVRAQKKLIIIVAIGHRREVYR